MKFCNPDISKTLQLVTLNLEKIVKTSYFIFSSSELKTQGQLL